MLVFPFKNKKDGKIYIQMSSYHLITARHSIEHSSTEKYGSIRDAESPKHCCYCYYLYSTQIQLLHYTPWNPLPAHHWLNISITKIRNGTSLTSGCKNQTKHLKLREPPSAAPLLHESIPAAMLSDQFSVPLAWNRTRLLPARENQF